MMIRTYFAWQNTWYVPMTTVIIYICVSTDDNRHAKRRTSDTAHGTDWWKNTCSLVSIANHSDVRPVSGEFPAQRPVTRSYNVFFHLCLNKWLSKQSWGWWFETPSPSLWRHRNGSEHFCSNHFTAVRFMPISWLRRVVTINQTLMSMLNGHKIADAIFKGVFLNENYHIVIRISLKYVSMVPNNFYPALIHIMVCRRTGLLAHIYIHVTRPRRSNPTHSYAYRYTSLLV